MKTLTTICFFFLFFAINLTQAQTVVVTDIDDLKSTVNEASPGDIIEIKDGTYDGNSMTITAKGTAEAPITIRAESIGGVTFVDGTKFVLRTSEYVIIQGIVFENNGTAVKLEGCNNIRITRNTFRLNETSSTKWVYIGGVWNEPTTSLSHHNRIDHNTFEGKKEAGHYITIDGSGETIQSQFDLIDHNLFRDNQPRITNEKESIRVGWSEMSESSGYTVIEFNYFEECNGDPEIISVKSCDNVVRHNTISKSEGTISLRHGNRNRVEGNYFFGGGAECSSDDNGTYCTGGVRLYGEDHVVINNYFEGLKGERWDAPITLTEGDAESGNSSLSKHFRIERAIIVYNTLVNNDHNIEIGMDNNGNYSKPPRDVIMAYNLVQGSQNSLVKFYNEPDNMTWRNNVMFPMGEATLSSDGRTFAESEINLTNPNLVFDEATNTWRSTESTPVLAADDILTGAIDEDIHGQERGESSSVGADNFSMESIRYAPLTAEDVGPYSYHPDYDGETGIGYITTSVSEMTFEANGGSQVFELNSNMDWSIEADMDWISFDVETGSGSANILVNVEANTEVALRQGTVIIIGESVNRQIQIFQEPKDLGGEKLPVVEVTASAEQVDATHDNGKENVLDEDFSTRWSAEGEQFITLDLGGLYTVSYLKVAFYNGDERSTHYQIDVSTDNVNFTNVVPRTLSAGLTDDFEIIDFEDIDTRYVRLTGFGNTGGSDWNSITEIEVWGFGELVDIEGLAIEENLVLYPLPADKNLYIKNLPLGYSHFRLYNLQGMLVGTGELQGNEINLEGLKPTTSSMILELYGEQKRMFSKVIVLR